MRDMSELPDLKVALVQTTLAWHDREANLEHFGQLLDQAHEADLVILPEMFTTGFSMESEKLAEPEAGPASVWRAGAGQTARRGGDRQCQSFAPLTAAIVIACCGRARMASCCITTSGICSAWRVSMSTTRRVSVR